MSAEVLREAARLMRQRAEAATEGPWAWQGVSENDNGWCLGVVWSADDKPIAGRVQADEGEVVDQVCELMFASSFSDPEHIASWHPGVALAVADWLDGQAKQDEFLKAHGKRGATDASQSVVVARAYLGVTP